MAKKSVILVSALLQIAVGFIQTQQVIENPAKPLNKTAGRMIELKEILKITDEGGEFYFKFPNGPRLDTEGSIFVQDNEQILKFDKDGKFIRNYFKKGQGPGEMTYAISLIPMFQGLCIQSGGPPKIVWFDGAGKLVRERPVRSPGRTLLRLLSVFGDTYIFYGSEFPIVTGEPQYVDNPYSLYSMRDGSEALKPLQSFPVKSFVIMAAGGGGGMYSIARFIAAPFQPRSFVIAHTCEYLVKFFDSEANAVVRTFTRKYERVETPPPKPDEKRGGVMINGKSYPAPPQKYLNDISNVFVVNDAIWVVTSTKDPKKGVLVDVFDEKGVYKDNFYLNIPAGQFAIFNNFCLNVEKNPDETYAVKKYEILWKD
jgi:hypothetical protein